MIICGVVLEINYLYLYLYLKVVWFIRPRLGHVMLNVVDPGKGVCADPVNRDAILGKGGTGPGGGDKECQLSLDKEGDKT